MAISINDLDDDDVIETGGQEPSPAPATQVSNDDGDYMSQFLKTRGIDDPSNIMFEDEDGQIETRNWDDLNDEEKFNILNTPIDYPQQNVEDNLDADEINLLNSIRSSGMSVQDYLQNIQGEPIVQEPTYKVDDLDDDSLYILDMETKVGEMSEEEAAQALSVAKQNEDLYKRQIEGLRKEYKEREDDLAKQQEAEQMAEQEEAFNQYQGQVINAIQDFNTVGNLDLSFEDNDKEDLARFMLSQDETGSIPLYRALQDPQTLVKAAWFILNGDEAFNSVSDYFINQIKATAESQYKKGFEDGKKGQSNSSKPSLVINKKPTHRQITKAEDLDDDDD